MKVPTCVSTLSRFPEFFPMQEEPEQEGLFLIQNEPEEDGHAED